VEEVIAAPHLKGCCDAWTAGTAGKVGKKRLCLKMGQQYPISNHPICGEDMERMISPTAIKTNAWMDDQTTPKNTQ
jgi:hypothetical protein